MGSSLAWIALSFGLPVLAGFLLARHRPAMPAPFAAIVSAIPLLAAFGLLVGYLQGSGTTAPFGLAAILVFGTICLLCGFGLGMVGHMLGNRRGK